MPAAAERSVDVLCLNELQREKSSVLGELGWLLTREGAMQSAVNVSLSQQKRSVLIETQVRQESFQLCTH